MSVLKLSRSRRWDLATTREHALAGSDAIVQKKISLEKILLGKVDKWVEEGYCALISRWDGLSDAEMVSLDTQTQLKIWRLRDRAWGQLLSGARGRNLDRNESNKGLQTLGGASGQICSIREVFNNELKRE